MTAGKGVQHSEMFPLMHEDKPNPMELFQIWLNLPKKSKMVEPHFKMLWDDAIPNAVHVNADGAKTTVEVIAGKLDNHTAPSPPPDSWAAALENGVAIWNVIMEPNAGWTLPKASPGTNRTLYYYVGDNLQADGKRIPRYHGVEVLADREIRLKNGTGESRILMLQSKPIGEPVMQYGPFVMNTKAEIQQAFDDYNRTQFGNWPWPKKAQVHDKSLGSIALHVDGRRELKPS